MRYIQALTHQTHTCNYKWSRGFFPSPAAESGLQALSPFDISESRPTLRSEQEKKERQTGSGRGGAGGVRQLEGVGGQKKREDGVKEGMEKVKKKIKSKEKKGQS